MFKPKPYAGRNAAKRVQCNLRLPPELLRHLKAAAKRRGGSLNGELNLRLEITRSLDTYEAMQRTHGRSSEVSLVGSTPTAAQPRSGVSRKPRLTV